MKRWKVGDFVKILVRGKASGKRAGRVVESDERHARVKWPDGTTDWWGNGVLEAEDVVTILAFLRGEAWDGPTTPAP